MSILSYPALGVAWGVIKYVIGVPIVHKALDNWVEGTSNKIDDMVWEFIERMAQVPHAERAEVIALSAWDLQRKYNDAKSDGTLPTLKSAVKRWDSAALIGEMFPSGNVG